MSEKEQIKVTVLPDAIRPEFANVLTYDVHENGTVTLSFGYQDVELKQILIHRRICMTYPQLKGILKQMSAQLNI